MTPQELFKMSKKEMLEMSKTADDETKQQIKTEIDRRASNKQKRLQIRREEEAFNKKEELSLQERKPSVNPEQPDYIAILRTKLREQQIQIKKILAN